MNIFVDTSAFLAVLDRNDHNHKKAAPYWEKIIKRGDVLLCHNYILVETSALILRRFGMEAVRIPLAATASVPRYSPGGVLSGI